MKSAAARFIVASQIMFNDSLLLESLLQNPQRVAGFGFGIATYALMFSAFQTLNAEGYALWIFWTVPRALTSILKEKAKLWGGIALVYPAGVLVAYLLSGGKREWAMLGHAATVLIGIPIYTVIAIALGVFACNPFAQDLQRRVKVSYVYLFMMLGSAYVFGIMADDPAQTAVTVVLSACLAAALWQMASDHLPFLLDPAAAPPARVSVSDGIMAVMGYFVVQTVAVVAMIRTSEPGKIGMDDIALASGIAGISIWAIVRFIYWRWKAEGIPHYFGPGTLKGLAWGVVGAAVATGFGAGYLWAVNQFGWFSEMRALAEKQALTRDLWFYGFVVLAAPLAEEFLFRGLIFGGLARSRPVWQAALASAALFAIVHPQASWLPVFGLGVVTAVVYRKGGTLAGAVLTHAMYNAVILYLS